MKRPPPVKNRSDSKLHFEAGNIIDLEKNWRGYRLEADAASRTQKRAAQVITGLSLGGTRNGMWTVPQGAKEPNGAPPTLISLKSRRKVEDEHEVGRSARMLF